MFEEPNEDYVEDKPPEEPEETDNFKAPPPRITDVASAIEFGGEPVSTAGETEEIADAELEIVSPFTSMFSPLMEDAETAEASSDASEKKKPLG